MEATNPRAVDALASLVREVRGYATNDAGLPDQSERDAMIEVADRAEHLFERLQAIIDWADLALSNPAEFDSHGVLNLSGPVFDEAREALAKSSSRGVG